MTDFVEESLARCRSSKHIVLQQLKSDEGNEFIFGLDDMAVHSRLSKDSEVVGDCDDIKDLIDNSLAYCRNSKQHLVPDAEHRHSYNTFIFLGSEDLGEQDDYPELKDYEENVGEPTNSSEDSEDDEPSYKYHHCSIKPCIMGCQAPDSRMDWRCADERPAKKQRCQ